MVKAGAQVKITDTAYYHIQLNILPVGDDVSRSLLLCSCVFFWILIFEVFVFWHFWAFSLKRRAWGPVDLLGQRHLDTG